MMALKRQAARLLDTVALPEEMLVEFIQRMQHYQREQERIAAKKKLDDVMSTFRSAAEQGGDEEAFRQLKSKYGSLSRALSGIAPQSLDWKAEKEGALREKYETAT